MSFPSSLFRKRIPVFWIGALLSGAALPVSAHAARYADWTAASFPESAPLASKIANADPDNDRLPNGIEWFFGTDPMAHDPAVPYRIRSAETGPVFEFQRSAEVPLEVAKVQLSSDLQHWQDSDQSVRVVIDSGQTVTHETDIAVAGESMIFVRLEVCDLLGPDAVVSFSFDQAAGSVAQDSGPGALQGELRDGASFASGFAQGNALELGGDAYLAVPLADELDLDGEGPNGAPFTICTWLKLDPEAELEGEEDRYAIAEKGIWTKPPFFSFGLRGGAFRGLYFQVHDASLEGQAYPLTIPAHDLSAAFEGGASWRHVAFVRGADGVGRLYLDGAEAGSQAGMDQRVDLDGAGGLARDGAISPIDELWIGRSYSRDGSKFDGMMADFRIFHEALDPVDLLQLVTAGRPGDDWQAWAPPPAVAASDKIVVSPAGDDASDGSEATPFATITRAIEAVHAAGETRRHIFVKHGIYREGLRRFVTWHPRSPNEMVIATPGVTLEAEPRGALPHEVASVRGSYSKSTPASSPLAGLYPDWEAQGGGVFQAELSGRLSNVQSMYFEGEPLKQYGETTMPGSLGNLWRGRRGLSGNDAQNLPDGGFWTTEALRICVPASGGAAVGDGQLFWITHGFSTFLFEFSEVDDGRVTAGAIPIPFSNGKDVFGEPDGAADTQAELAAAIMAALASPLVAATGLAPTLTDEHEILLGERQQAGGAWITLNTRRALSFSCFDWEVFVKLPGGLDPNDPEVDLEIPLCLQILTIQGEGVTVRGFDFRHTNSTALVQAAGIEISGHRALVEDNHISDCDFAGVNVRADFRNGMAYSREGVVLLKNRINRCGDSGIGSTFTRDCRFVGNETSRNNARNFNQVWHAGGFKLNNNHEDLRVIQHTARGNQGSGIWFDTVGPRHRSISSEAVIPAAISVEISECVLEFNARQGCFYEKSRNGTLVDNTVRYNHAEGIRISKSSNCLVARNLICGNRSEGILKDPAVAYLTLRSFSVPSTHPLVDNWSNTQVYSVYPYIGNRFFNNILRNNALVNFANFDAADAQAAVAAGWGNLLTNGSGASVPVISIPGDTGSPDEHYSGLSVHYTHSNHSDYNIVWKADEPVTYGYSSSTYIFMDRFESTLAGTGGFLDYKDLDVGYDGKADRVFRPVGRVQENGLSTHYQTFPNVESYAFDTMTQALDSFEFLDDPAAEAHYAAPVPGAFQLMDPDTDGDGLTDRWESVHGLNPTSADGLHGASGDPDGDGRNNLEEFQNWMRGTLPSGDPYGSVTEYRSMTWPTYHSATAIGRAKDLDGDQLPDAWERYYGLDPFDASDGAANLPLFRKGKTPGPLADDSDGDLLPDEWELAHFSNLDQSAEGDADADGFSNALEFRLWTLPNAADDPRDLDQDGLSDVWEVLFGFSTTSGLGVDGGAGDADGDGLSNRDELEQFTNPLRANSPSPQDP